MFPSLFSEQCSRTGKFLFAMLMILMIAQAISATTSNFFASSLSHCNYLIAGAASQTLSVSTDLVFENNVNGANSGSCWHISANPVDSVILMNVKISRMSCDRGDNLTIFDDNATGRVLYSACDDEDSSTYGINLKTKSNSVLVQFTSELLKSWATRGDRSLIFKITYSKTDTVSFTPLCIDGNISRNSANNNSAIGLVQSYGFPFQYFNNSQCKWPIQVSLDAVILMTLKIFGLEDCHLCSCDRVVLYEPELNVAGRNGNEDRYQTCFPGQRTFKTKSNKLIVEFITDSSITRQQTSNESKPVGFQLEYREIPTMLTNHTIRTMHYIHGKTAGTISNNGQYQNGTDLWWNLTTSVNSRISYTISIHWIEFCAYCTCDFLLVTEDDPTLLSSLHGGIRQESAMTMKHCGQSISMSSSLSSGNTLFVNFYTDSSISSPPSQLKKGFEISFEEVPNSFCTSTNVIAGKPNGTIQNYEFPNVYHNNVRCQWRLSVSYGARIRDCDHISIYDGHSKTQSALLGEICQQYTSTVITTESNLALIYFYTDNSNSDVAELSSLACGFQIFYLEIWDEDQSRAVDHSNRNSQLYLTLLLSVIGVVLFFAAILITIGVSYWRRLRHLKKINLRIAPSSVAPPPAERNINYIGLPELNALAVDEPCYIDPGADMHSSHPLTLADIIRNHNCGDTLPASIADLEIASDRLKITDTVIGKGAAGVVQKGFLLRPDKEVEEVVAVKSLKLQGTDNIVALLKEAAIMKRFDNQNVLKLIGVTVVYDQPKIVAPFMAHGNLRDLLSSAESTQYCFSQLLHFCYQVCSGMVYLESQRCIHRDLACRNILVSEDGTLKVSDFGMARAVRREHNYIYQAGRVPLPIRWHPPESLAFQRFHHKSDVWSFGVVVWEILSLCKTEPYGEIEALEEVVTAVHEGKRLEIPERCPPEFYRRIVTPCWQLKSSARPKFSELLHDIGEWKLHFEETQL